MSKGARIDCVSLVAKATLNYASVIERIRTELSATIADKRITSLR